MPYGNDEWVLLRIFSRESRVEGKLQQLVDMGFEGFTVLRGVAGYGRSGQTSEDIVWESLDLPVVIEIFTTYGKFKERQKLLMEKIGGLITLERTTLDP